MNRNTDQAEDRDQGKNAEPRPGRAGPHSGLLQLVGPDICSEPLHQSYEPLKQTCYC